MTRWIRETVITLLIVLVALAWWRDHEKSSALEAFTLKLDAYGDSLEESRAHQYRLGRLADSLRHAQARRDTVYLRGRTVYLAARASATAAAADPATSADDLRAHLARVTREADTTIAACEAGRETCEERVATAEAARDEARRETQLVTDSTATEVDRAEAELVEKTRALWRQRLYTIGALLLAALGILTR